MSLTYSTRLSDIVNGNDLATSYYIEIQNLDFVEIKDWKDIKRAEFEDMLLSPTQIIYAISWQGQYFFFKNISETEAEEAIKKVKEDSNPMKLLENGKEELKWEIINGALVLSVGPWVAKFPVEFWEEEWEEEWEG